MLPAYITSDEVEYSGARFFFWFFCPAAHRVRMAEEAERAAPAFPEFACVEDMTQVPFRVSGVARWPGDVGKNTIVESASGGAIESRLTLFTNEINALQCRIQ